MTSPVTHRVVVGGVGRIAAGPGRRLGRAAAHGDRHPLAESGQREVSAGERGAPARSDGALSHGAAPVSARPPAGGGGGGGGGQNSVRTVAGLR